MHPFPPTQQSPDQLFERLCAILKEDFGLKLSVHPKHQHEVGLLFAKSTTMLRISVHQLKNGKTYFHFVSPVLTQLDVSHELLRYVATHASRAYIGSLSLRMDENGHGDLYVEHALLAPTADPVELYEALFSVHCIADQLDDELQVRFGGSRLFEGGLQ